MKYSGCFHISALKIDCGYLLEPPRRGGSNEYQQFMFWSRNKKTNAYPCKPQFYCIKIRFKRSKLYRRVFVMDEKNFDVANKDCSSCAVALSLKVRFLTLLLTYTLPYSFKRGLSKKGILAFFFFLQVNSLTRHTSGRAEAGFFFSFELEVLNSGWGNSTW